MLDHLSIQCADVGAAAAFYDTVLAPLGGGRLLELGTVSGFGVGGKPSFWIGPLADDAPNREVHIAFVAPDRGGAEVLHEPRVWPEYHPHYYGAFVRDPDGNNVEAVCHSPE